MNADKRTGFKRTLIAVSAELALCGVAVAQDVPVKEKRDLAAVESIVVTGSRLAMEKSVALKKNSTIVQDSISSEDMGRFPDDSVADALGHITGVTVQRGGNNGVGGGGGIGGAGGEGMGVSIRGLGPDFALTLLNGRLLATDANTRNFAFDTLPSEVISGADVYKSARASHMEGAIGGVVNLKTTRPLDRKGIHASVRVDANTNDLSGYGGNKVAAGFNGTFLNDTVGVSLGLMTSKSKIRTDGIDDYAYVPLAPLCGGCYPNIAVNGSTTAKPIVMFENFGIGTMTQVKNRSSFTGTLEWKPANNIRMAADFLITKLKAPQFGNSQSYSFGQDGDSSFLKNATAKNDVITGFDSVPTDTAAFFPEIFQRKKDRTVDTTVYGWNGEWKVSDSLTLTGDIYQSKAKRYSGHDNLDVSAILSDPASASYRTSPNSMPSITVTLADGRDLAKSLANGTILPADYSLATLRITGDDIDDKVTGLNLSGKYKLDKGVFDSIDFGAGQTERTKTRAFYSNDRLNYTNPGSTTSYRGGSQYRGVSFDRLPSGLITLVTPENFMRGLGGQYPMSMYDFNSDELLAALKQLDGKPSRWGGTGFNLANTLRAVKVLNRSFTVDEKSSTMFGELNLSGDSWFGNMGVRYVKTDTRAQNGFPSIVSFSGTGVNAKIVQTADVPTVVDASDTRYLPSANFGFWLRPNNLLLRVGAAQTISRPDLGSLSPVYDVDPARKHILYYGHPGLKPTEATQADLSLEWYYKRDSLVNAAVFSKKVKKFIVFTSVPGETVNVLNTDTGKAEPFTTERPTNGDSANVKGIELGVLHLFDNGFGINAKFTKTTSVSYVDGQNIGILPGVAPSASSLTFLYEKDKISTQLSIDHTGAYLDTYKFASAGLRRDIRAMNWVGATFSYEFMKGVKVFVEGRNLTDASERVTLEGVPQAPFAFSTWGRTYVLGLRAQY